MVVPAYGRSDLTWSLVRQLADSTDVSVVVVDNDGRYTTVAGETVLCPGQNIGWLRGTNLGIRHALRNEDITHICMLNNDVVLAAGFIQAMVTACRQRRVGLVAPSYDDHYAVQTAYFSGPATEFVPAAAEVDADVVDGTCLMLSRETLDDVGLLDERRFGRYGWGGADDLCLRIRESGRRVVVTRRAYLQHQTSATARIVYRDYQKFAAAEMVLGMRRKYGRKWMRHFPSGSFDHHSGSLKEFCSCLLTTWTDRFRTTRAAWGR